MSNKSIVCSSRRSSSCMLPPWTLLLLLLLLLPAMPDAAAATRRARIAAPSSSGSNNNELLTETAAGKLKTTADSKYGESYIGIGMKWALHWPPSPSPTLTRNSFLATSPAKTCPSSTTTCGILFILFTSCLIAFGHDLWAAANVCISFNPPPRPLPFFLVLLLAKESLFADTTSCKKGPPLGAAKLFHARTKDLGNELPCNQSDLHACDSVFVCVFVCMSVV